MKKISHTSGDSDVQKFTRIPAGDFSSWLRSTRKAQIEKAGSDVPCGECTACCTSSYFIHILPHETETTASIPKMLLFPAPLQPEGNFILGYNKNGLCPMIAGNACLIYEHRPLTCRRYDCRLFSAAGIEAGGDDKLLINRQIQRWEFSYPSMQDHAEHKAVLAAAAFLRNHGTCFPPDIIPNNQTRLALFAVKVYDLFLNCNDAEPAPDSEFISTIIKAYKTFEEQCAE